MGDHFNHGTRNVCWGKEQYELLKTHFMQQSPLAGIREGYYDRTCWLGMDIDSSPIIFNLSLLELHSQLEQPHTLVTTDFL